MLWHSIDNGCSSNFVPIFLHHAILHHWHRWSCPMLTLPAAAAPRRVTAIISHHCHCVAVIWNNVSVSSAAADPEAIHVASGGLAELPSGPLSTKTVLGFLDFTTTVSDTVIKFTSQGGPLFLFLKTTLHYILLQLHWFTKYLENAPSSAPSSYWKLVLVLSDH